jgi:hypothetical protein
MGWLPHRYYKYPKSSPWPRCQCAKMCWCKPAKSIGTSYPLKTLSGLQPAVEQPPGQPQPHSSIATNGFLVLDGPAGRPPEALLGHSSDASTLTVWNQA